MTPEELLLKAADEIARTGHCKGMYYTGGDERTAAVCAYGAMARAASDGRTADYFGELDGPGRALVRDAAALLASEIYPFVSDPFHIITRFNDEDSTTGEDVILAMKRAAHE
jgi:hypothetical protein